MSYELLIETKKAFNTSAMHLLHELILGGIITAEDEIGVAALISIDGIDSDTVNSFTAELSRDETLTVSEYHPDKNPDKNSDKNSDKNFVVLSPRMGTFLPHADIAYKQILLKEPDLSDVLRIREYAYFYATGDNSAAVIRSVEKYIVDMGEYRRLTADELIKLGIGAELPEKGKTAAYRQPPSLGARENPGLSEPFSTTKSKMVMDRYRNTTRDDMKKMAFLSSKSGKNADWNNAGYMELGERLNRVGVNMELDDAKDAQSYFRMEGREPTEMELRIINRCRSERWAHPTIYTAVSISELNDESVKESIDGFKELNENSGINNDNITLVDIVNAPLRYLTQSSESVKGDSSVREIDPKYIFSMENGNCGLILDTDTGKRKLAITLESNNTKTSVDPAGGATACLGTSLRRALGKELHPYDVVRVSGIATPFAPDDADTNVKAEAAEQRRLAVNSLDSFSEYARTVGVPCSGNFEYTSDRFAFKHMEVSATLSVSERKGTSEDDYIAYEVEEKEKKKIASGDTIVIFGSRTGRDGRVYRRYLSNKSGEKIKQEENAKSVTGQPSEPRIRSELIKLENAIIADNVELMGEAVPRGDALIQNKLMRICSAPLFTSSVKRVRDVDSSGIVPSVAALNLGAEIYLDCVPVKYNDMSSTDVAFSETCERIIAVVDPNNADSVIECCAEHGIICARIGFITDDRKLKVYGGGIRLADISVDFLINSENNRYITADVKAPQPQRENEILEIANAPFRKRGLIDRLLYKYSADHPSAYKKIAESCKIKAGTRKRRFDNTFFENTGISHMNSGFAPVSVSYIRDSQGALCKNGHRLCSAVTVGMHADVCDVDPYKGAYYAMTDTLSRLVASGVPRRSAYAALHLFHPAYKSDPEQNGDTLAAVAGLYDAQMRLGYPILCGDYSLGGINNDNAKPAVAVFGIATGKEETFRSSGFKASGNKLCLFKPEIGKDGVPEPESQIEVYDKVEELFAEGKARSAVALTGMCLAEGVMYMGFGADGKCGFAFDDDCTPEELYGLLYGAIAVELDPEDAKEMPKGSLYGTVIDTPAITLKYKTISTEPFENKEAEGLYGTEKLELNNDRLSISIPYLKSLSRNSLTSVYEISPYPEIRMRWQPRWNKLSAQSEKQRRTHFCVYDTKKPIILVPCFTSSIGVDGMISALKKEELASDVEIKRIECRTDSEGAEELAEHIKGAQMLCLPDFAESPSLIASVLRYPAVERAIETLRARKGLIYGCGAAFSALIQAGYIGRDFGIGAIDGLAVASNPLSGLTRMPSLVNIVSDYTPFLCAADKNTLYRTEISSYAGRLVGNLDMLNTACVYGVISTVYAEDKKEFGIHFRYNPCESAYRIDSMISEDGLIFGQLSFPYRADYPGGIGFGGYAPLPIFRSAIDYLLHRQNYEEINAAR